MATKINDMHFGEPIRMDLNGNPGVVDFKSLSEFHEWLDADVNFWAAFDSKMNLRGSGRELQEFVRLAREQRNHVKFDGKIAPIEITDSNSVIKILESYAMGYLLHHQSNAAIKMDILVATGQMNEAAYLFIAAHPGNIDFSLAMGGSFDINPLLHAYFELVTLRGPKVNDFIDNIEAKSKDAQTLLSHIEDMSLSASAKLAQFEESVTGMSGIETKINSLEQKLETEIESVIAPLKSTIETKISLLTEDINNSENALKAKYVAMSENLDNKFDEVFEKSSTEINGFMDAIKDEHNLKTAENFWINKRFWHRVGYGITGVLFVLGVIATIGSFGYWAEEYLQYLHIFPKTPPPKIAAPLVDTKFIIPLTLLATLPIVGAFWILRQLLKMFLTNLAQSSDAAERIAMTQTFLELETSGHIQPNDRALVIQALFRSGPGGTHDETGVTLSLVENLIKHLDPKKP